MSEQVREVFVSELKDVFAFLVAYGFRFREDTIEDRTFFVRAAYTGNNIAFEFSLDKREQLVECDVCSVLADKIARFPVNGGYYKPLQTYLIQHCGFRSSIRDSLRGDRPIRQKIRDALEAYAEILKTRGAILLTDKAEVLV